MENFCCEICNFKTDRKANYSRHLRSDRHIKKSNGDDNSSVVSNITEPDDMSWKQSVISSADKEIMELKYQMEMMKKEHEIATLKMQLTLQQQQQQIQLPMQQPTNNIQLEIQEVAVAKPKPKPISEKEMLTNRINNGCLTFNQFINEYVNNFGMWKYAKDYKGYYIPKSLHKKNLIIEVLCDLIEEVNDREKLPIYCSDERRKVLHILTEDGWIKGDDNDKTIRKYINNLVCYIHRQIMRLCELLCVVYKKKSSIHHELKKYYGSKDTVGDSISEFISRYYEFPSDKLVQKTIIQLSNSTTKKAKRYVPEEFVPIAPDPNDTQSDNECDDDNNNCNNENEDDNTYRDESDSDNDGDSS
jgi:hypothetical protein